MNTMLYEKPRKQSLSLYEKAKLGKVQMTIPKEKEKALERDGYKCISCDRVDSLDFHHIAFHNSERIYDETRNKYYRGVILCRDCHSTLPRNTHLDEYCRLYITHRHPEIYGKAEEREIT